MRSLLDYSAYFELMRRAQPESHTGVLKGLEEEGLIVGCGEDTYHVANLGAILFAKDLQKFAGLARKAVRVIVYDGLTRVKALREQEGRRGYASGFQGLVKFINDQLPHNELIEQAVRKEVPMYPEIAIRELVANMLIHQDFSVTGAGPMVEIFSDRIEITNPGTPLIDVRRFLDLPPRSRNETLAALMRRMGICEERGSGIDKVLFEIEYFQLPAPEFKETGGSTRATLFSPRDLSRMDPAERIRACYLHASLCWVTGRPMTNATLRERLRIADHNYSIASRIIKETTNAKLIRRADPSSKSNKTASYAPFWA